MSTAEVEKRKREKEEEEDGGNSDGKPRGDRADPKRVAPPLLPPDEEVEEFFAMVKRIRVALKYFQRREGDGVRRVPAKKPTWNPSFEREDFDGVKTETGSSHGRGETGLDLNADPVSSDSV